MSSRKLPSSSTASADFTSALAPACSDWIAATCAGAVRIRAIHVAISIRNRWVRDLIDHEPGSAQLRAPLVDAIVAHVAGIAQQLDRLQVGVQQRIRQGERVHEHRLAAAPSHPPRLAQAGLQITPVMCAHPADYEIEGLVLERQALRRSLARGDVADPAPLRLCRHRGEHARRQIARHDLSDMGCDAIADVTAPTPEVERAAAAMRLGDSLDAIEIGAGGVYRAAHIGLRLRAELPVGSVVVGGGHGNPQK